VGVRVDSHVYAGYEVPRHYDSLLAKLIVHAPSRKEAILRMEGALREFTIGGVKTTTPFLLKVLQNEDFQKGDFDTSFIDTAFAEDDLSQSEND
jgi:acetyl-CoA carboxylase biotin carboxylase subunit